MEIITYDGLVAGLRAAGCVFAEDEAQMLISAARSPIELAAMADQRVLGHPLEHVIGWMEFCGLRIEVDPGVFIPRLRTEFLVQRATEIAQSGDVVLDLCCGTGALGAVLAAEVKDTELYAVDIDPKAVQCARRNITAVGGHVFEGDIFAPLPVTLHNRIDILLANVPYVPTEAIELLPSEARIHEARLALDGGEDGLDVLRRVALEAPLWLAPGGHLLVEVSERQALQAVEIFVRNGLIPTVSRFEELDATVIVGTRHI
ncbi:putative protein N(5)-glutamine methyltransferase [Paenibacillus chondroitinus]|uniref:peptide chain release factor N(5)-glutamine methyltransferase n=2 Tax=Paenibacillus TaxID=44249 RepID=A0ABU6DAG9_9BACL|nr:MULTISPECIES: putative protein N(5)-glutamine methyltransferase [Paenibacillus]MCY9662224.1 putative protein N(5)-glutamine methyltransferase [Paenibacillus anseongense]MEB4794738.1 putative protein N(5)-glutamine methyltransferase [Paenibacillus chondroitinus]